MYVLIIAFIFRRLGWRKGGIVVLSAILTVTFCSLFSHYMKELTERLRPLLDIYMLENSLHVLETGGKYTFFSAHSANAFGLATSTYWGLRMDNRKYDHYAIFMYTWATLVAVSRIFVGKHYLGDVLVGICVGIVAGMMFAWMARKVSFRITN
jgi:undecaprenyl-diphosphatase